MKTILRLFVGFIKTLVSMPLQPLYFFFNPERFSSKHLLRFLIGILVAEVLFLVLVCFSLWVVLSEFPKTDTTLLQEYLDSQWDPLAKSAFQQSLPARLATGTFPEPADTPYQLIPSKIIIHFCDSLTASFSKSLDSFPEKKDHLQHAERRWKRALSQQKDSIQKTPAYQQFIKNGSATSRPALGNGHFVRADPLGIWVLLLIPLTVLGLYFNLSAVRLLWRLPEVYFATIPAFYEFAKISAPIVGFIRWSFLFLYLLLLLNIVIGVISLISVLIGLLVILMLGLVIVVLIAATFGLILLSDNFTVGKLFSEVWGWATFPLQFFKWEETLLKSLGINPEFAVLMQATLIVVLPMLICYWLLKHRSALSAFLERNKN